MATTAELFSGIESANITERGNPLGVGLYTLEVTKCINKHTFKQGDAFIVEFKVLSSTNEEHAVGTKASWYRSMQYRNSAHGEIKAFTLALLGKDPQADAEEIQRDINPHIAKTLIAAVDQNAFKGQKVAAEVAMGAPNDEGKSYPQWRFSPIEG